jgi:hypothetical protein
VRRLLPLSLILWTAAGIAPAQRAVSARAGLIHYVEGQVLLEGARVPSKFTHFAHVDEGQTLATRRGRVEILLNPTTFLRVAENSSIRLICADLAATRVEILTGSAMIEVLDLDNANAVTVELKGSGIDLPKTGLYHLDASGHGRLRVYGGEARIDAGAAPLKVKAGNEVVFTGPPVQPVKFDRSQTDALYRWNERRARTIERMNFPRRRPYFG